MAIVNQQNRFTNTTSVVSVVVSPRRGSRQRPVQDTQVLCHKTFLHANDNLTSEMRYTARGRFMSCRVTTLLSVNEATWSPPPTSSLRSLPMVIRNLSLTAVCADHRCDGHGFNISNTNVCASAVNLGLRTLTILGCRLVELMKMRNCVAATRMALRRSSACLQTRKC